MVSNVVVSDLYELLASIEKARIKLKSLINEKGNLLDPEVIKKSQEIDILIVKYFNLANTTIQE